VTLAWPYFDVFALAGDSTVDEVHRRLYLHPWQWYGLAAVGLPALALRTGIASAGRRNATTRHTDRRGITRLRALALRTGIASTTRRNTTTRHTDRQGITRLRALAQRAGIASTTRRNTTTRHTEHNGITRLRALAQRTGIGRTTRPSATTSRTERNGITGLRSLAQRAGISRTTRRNTTTRHTDRHGITRLRAIGRAGGRGVTDLAPHGGRVSRRPALRDPLVLMFGADCLIAGYGWVSGHYTYGRVFALLLVAPQFALAVELAAAPPWTRLRALLAPLAALALCFGLVAQIGSVVPQRLLPVAVGHPSRWADYRWAADRIPVGGVLLTDGYRAGHVLPAYGVYLVAPAWPDPSTPAADRARRFADVATYLSPRTSAATRAAIVRRYGVGWLLLTPGQRVPYNGRLVATGPRTGERLIRLAEPPRPTG
jgi:lambda repressor-like predicted transcriptional regulator